MQARAVVGAGGGGGGEELPAKKAELGREHSL